MSEYPGDAAFAASQPNRVNPMSPPMTPTSRQWSVMNIPGVALCIVWNEGDPSTQICQMRWTDGLRPDVEAAVLADAEFIVRVVNAHDTLVAALQAIIQVEHIDGVDGGRIRYEFDFRSPLAQQVRDALKLAEKKP